MYYSASFHETLHGSDYGSDGRKQKTFDGQDKAQFPLWQVEVNRVLTSLGVSAVSERGRVSFLSTDDPRPDEFSDDTHPRITEEFLESQEGDKYRENNFRVGDPHLTGQHLGKYLRAHAIALQERRKACANILQLVKQHSTLSSAIEKAARTHDPNAVLRAVELFYNSKTFSTCFTILSTFKQQKVSISKDNVSQGLNVMRAYRIVIGQFFSIFDERDRKKKYIEIWDLFHFCDMVLLRVMMVSLFHSSINMFSASKAIC